MRTETTMEYKLRQIRLPLIILGIFLIYGTIMWFFTKSSFFIFDLPYIGISIAAGGILGAFLPGKYQNWGRVLTQLMIGVYMFFVLGVLWHVNMQIESFFFLIFSVSFGGALVHYLPAKILGPLVFNRGWCGWGCWTASVLDLFPWKKNLKGRIRNLGVLRYIHLAFVITLTAVLWFAFGYKPQADLIDPLIWFLVGNAVYYVSAILLAILLKDNRAFCKYLCPIPPLQKILGRFAFFRLKTDLDKCTSCGACDRSCIMNLDLKAYRENESGIIKSTECVLCMSCVNTCPQKAMNAGIARGIVKKEYVKYRK